MGRWPPPGAQDETEAAVAVAMFNGQDSTTATRRGHLFDLKRMVQRGLFEAGAFAREPAPE